jgi:DMSO/TMAO reductase YedYZ molybdopterin-dependent catalytic subunit
MISRRKMITTGVAAVAGVAGLAAASRIAGHYGLIPPDSGGIWGVGETLTYAAQRVLMSHHSMAREFNRSDVSKVVPVSGLPPKTEAYERLLAGGFNDWRLTVDGMVARPATFALDELKRMPAWSQITHQACEEGWSFICQWTGVPLSYVLNLVGVSKQAKYVVVYAFDDVWDSLDMPDAYHPQTFLTYGMNGPDLSGRAWCSASSAGGAATGVQEREVSVAHYGYRFLETCWRWSGFQPAGVWVLVVRGDLSWVVGIRDFAE